MSNNHKRAMIRLDRSRDDFIICVFCFLFTRNQRRHHQQAFFFFLSPLMISLFACDSTNLTPLLLSESSSMEKKKYPIGAEHYTLYEEVGQGVSASVHRSLCIPFNDIVAIKILDFERDNCDLNNVSREAQIMILIDHPNVLKSHCSFVSDHNLWVVMPYMSGGSCLHILKAAYPDGFEEVVIATILREVLKALEYLHHHGHIHRDVKAGNILIDSRGAIKLGDFGVSACLFDSGDRQRMRNTFVGTPCWMAPEVMEQLHGYDFKADIWSFGITALELAHGHAPFSKYPPMKVLLMTLQNAPPGLDYERDKKFSKSFKQMIASCLVKDPSKRPSAKKLLKHSFFKQARSNDYITRTLLDGLPALGDRIKALKRKEEDMLAQKKMPDGQKEEISQNEYKRGISGWNFNLEDLKAQASLIQDEDLISDSHQGGSSCNLSGLDVQDKQVDHVADMEESNLTLNVNKDRSDDDSTVVSPSSEMQASQNPSPRHVDRIQDSVDEKPPTEINGKSMEGFAASFNQRTASFNQRTTSFNQRTASFNQRNVDPSLDSKPLEGALAHTNKDSDKFQNQPQNNLSSNAATAASSAVDDVLPEMASKLSRPSANSDDPDEKTKPPVIQQRGRFKVTSENMYMEKVAPSPILQKSHSMQVLTQHPSAMSAPMSASAADVVLPTTLSINTLFPMLQSILHANIQQRETILNIMKQLSGADSSANRPSDGGSTSASFVATERSMLESAHDREKELLHEITDLQWRLICAQEEIQKYKTENPQV